MSGEFLACGHGHLRRCECRAAHRVRFGSIINSRQDGPIAASASVTIVLQGADLAIFAEDNRKRRVVIEGTYTSSLGSGLPLKAESEFSICDLVGVP